MACRLSFDFFDRLVLKKVLRRSLASTGDSDVSLIVDVGVSCTSDSVDVHVDSAWPPRP